MKPHILILCLILALPLAGHTATDDYTIPKKHRVIQEATLQSSSVLIGTKLSQLTFTALSGDTHSIDTLTEQGPVVFVFLATECPVAQRYTMRLKRLHTEFASQNTTFIAVYPNENDSTDDVKSYAAKSEFPFPIVKDATGELARALGATMTPQAILVDTTHTLRYRGAIDDNRYETRIKHHYLQDALLATHSDTEIPVQETPAFGCTLHLPETSLPTEVSYSKHIAPILQKNCQTCHRHGEVAPLSLIHISEPTRPY